MGEGRPFSGFPPIPNLIFGVPYGDVILACAIVEIHLKRTASGLKILYGALSTWQIRLDVKGKGTGTGWAIDERTRIATDRGTWNREVRWILNRGSHERSRRRG